MKCYVHQNTDAVGVCSACGRGVCRLCAVRLGGKLYCADDADRAFTSRRTVVEPRRTVRPRGVGVVVGSLSAYFLGGTAAIFSFLVLFEAMITGSSASPGLFASVFTSDLTFLGPIQRYPPNTILDLGIVLLIFGSYGIGAGYYLWRPSRAGAVAAVIFGVMGVAGAFELSTIPVSSDIVDVWFVLSGATIAMSFLALIQLTTPHKRGEDGSALQPGERASAESL